ncbi:DUF4232 domain-containing protein [Streptomyces hoynatensis]|uniref:DUF4232 domain-containing protein n=1 Tax=Streptomyces hoynatensis TaxID=1141874 RepID=A0A3A9ZES8_9ACTN|nr:DUF4232 domain-containing protein [Streptomyces hoynatensis]RKN46699.1 DUF4232 domain-containing protein [Streptomyces hoynatensis]
MAGAVSPGGEADGGTGGGTGPGPEGAPRTRPRTSRTPRAPRPFRARPSRTRRIALASGVAALGLLLGACGEGGAGEPEALSGTAEPVAGDQDGSTKDGSPGGGSAPEGAGGEQSPGEDSAAEGSGDGTEQDGAQGDGGQDSGAAEGATEGTADGGDGEITCPASEMSASVGRNQPGAGNSHFAVVVTNDWDESCALYGYPGVAFVDGSGRQLGPDPERDRTADPSRVTLAPGESAWAGLSFANPEISGAETAVPAYLWITPPETAIALAVPWDQGEVPVSGDTPTITAFTPGDGS